jgi:hypothetical protein
MRKFPFINDSKWNLRIYRCYKQAGKEEN